MDDSFHQQESSTQQPKELPTSLKIIDSVLNWLAGLFQLTEEEQEDAGIYFGDQRDR